MAGPTSRLSYLTNQRTREEIEFGVLMVVCRFEDAVGDRTLNLCGFVTKVTACSAQELPTAVAEIEQYQREGHWIALKLNYSLGEWLEPALRRGDVQGVSEARFSAYVFERCDETRASADHACWNYTHVGIVAPHTPARIPTILMSQISCGPSPAPLFALS